MSHWSEYLSHAVLHAECMKFTQIQLDPRQLMGAIQAAQAEQNRLSGILGSGFNPRIIQGR